jgi:NTE family protein
MISKIAYKILFSFLLSFSLIFAQTKTTLRFDLVSKNLPFGLIQRVPAAIPKIGLALSGGGARSVSQLGLLHAIQEEDLPIDCIVGTSMGSIIGGLYSAGYSLDELDSIFQNTKWEDFYTSQQSSRNELFIDQKITEDRAIISFRMDGLKPLLPTSVSSGQRAENFLNLLALNAPIQAEDNYDNYKIKFRAISSDLVSGREVIINKGSLGLAMQASSSVILLLPPVKRDSMLLVDGGLVANIPSQETRDLGADIVIAFNSSSPLYQENQLQYPWLIADQLVSIPMKKLNEQQLEESDFVIQPKLEGRINSDFSNLPDIIKIGYDASRPVVIKVKKEFENQFKSALNGEEIFYKHLSLSENPSKFEKTLYNSFFMKDSVSNKELLYNLYYIFKEGSFKDISINIIEQFGKSYFTINDIYNPLVSNIKIKGVTAFNNSDMFIKLDSLIGEPYNPRKTFNAVIGILHYYKSRGYSLARINNISFDEKTHTLFIKISEGLISKISVEGNNKTKERIITREFPLNKNSYFKYALAEKGLTNLRSTNLFDQINLEAIPSDSTNEVKINLIEKASGIIRFGMRIDNENYAQVSFDIRDENFNGTGTELGTTFSGGERNRSYSFEQKANRVFDSYLTYKVRAYYEFNNVNVYKDDSVTAYNTFSRSKAAEYRQYFYGGTFGIGAQVEKLGNLFVEARYERNEIENIQNYNFPSSFVDISSLRFSLYVDSQNEYPYPTKGMLINAFYETAQIALGGDVGYTKLFIDYKTFFGFTDNHVWSFRGVLGIADNTLPLSQQFSLGGQNSFYGMRDYEYRGRQIFAVSFEHSYKLPFKLFFDTYAKLRYDLGSVWLQQEQIKFADLKHGVGASLSFKTPIGPADFSVGKSFYFKNTLSNNSIIWGPAYFYFTIGFYY